MPAGKLTSRVTIQQRGTSQDALGQPVETWTAVATVWADIRHLAGIEQIKSAADVSLVKASIRIRTRIGMTAGMRVVHGSDIYDIQAVLQPADRAFLDLPCARMS